MPTPHFPFHGPRPFTSRPAFWQALPFLISIAISMVASAQHGVVVAGNIGTMRHLDFTLVGDAVNLASRLEGLNSMLGTHILMSGEIHARIGDEFRTRRVGRFRVKGRDEPVDVYELLGPVALQSEAPWQKRYAEAITALESSDPDQARLLFEAVLRERRDAQDGPSKFLLQCLTERSVLPDGTISLTRKASNGDRP